MIVADMAVGVCIRLGNGGGVVVGGVFVADAVGVCGISVALISICVGFVDNPHPLISKNTNENRILCFMAFSL
jgi:hypothetical protein